MNFGVGTDTIQPINMQKGGLGQPRDSAWPEHGKSLNFTTCSPGIFENKLKLPSFNQLSHNKIGVFSLAPEVIGWNSLRIPDGIWSVAGTRIERFIQGNMRKCGSFGLL